MMRFLLISVAGLFVLGSSLRADPLAVGAAAPAVTAVDQEGKAIVFADVYAKGVTLVYFYPKSGSPGCTMEACSLRDSYTKLQAKGLQIIGVSRDSVEAQQAFQTKLKLPFVLVADVDGKVAEAFGVPMKSKGLDPVASRQSFIVKDGKIAWETLKAETKGSAAEIQKALDELK